MKAKIKQIRNYIFKRTEILVLSLYIEIIIILTSYFLQNE